MPASKPPQNSLVHTHPVIPQAELHLTSTPIVTPHTADMTKAPSPPHTPRDVPVTVLPPSGNSTSTPLCSPIPVTPTAPGKTESACSSPPPVSAPQQPESPPPSAAIPPRPEISPATPMKSTMQSIAEAQARAMAFYKQKATTSPSSSASNLTAPPGPPKSPIPPPMVTPPAEKAKPETIKPLPQNNTSADPLPPVDSHIVIPIGGSTSGDSDDIVKKSRNSICIHGSSTGVSTSTTTSTSALTTTGTSTNTSTSTSSSTTTSTSTSTSPSNTTDTNTEATLLELKDMFPVISISFLRQKLAESKGDVSEVVSILLSDPPTLAAPTPSKSLPPPPSPSLTTSVTKGEPIPHDSTASMLDTPLKKLAAIFPTLELSLLESALKSSGGNIDQSVAWLLGEDRSEPTVPMKRLPDPPPSMLLPPPSMLPPLPSFTTLPYSPPPIYSPVPKRPRRRAYPVTTMSPFMFGGHMFPNTTPARPLNIKIDSRPCQSLYKQTFDPVQQISNTLQMLSDKAQYVGYCAQTMIERGKSSINNLTYQNEPEPQ
ncbi:hypothetical protein Pelo_5609 [Pelomyxa schiedti]|nr:hypothetical protein Pelo_5609 [Pelomyxa schiedti]